MSKIKPSIIAECIAVAGYGTNYFDPETYECFHEAYADVKIIILNEEYWNQYDSMSTTLNNDFYIGMNFDTYKLIVYSDGSKEKILIRN